MKKTFNTKFQIINLVILLSLSNYLIAANNSFCNSQLMLPSVTLNDNSVYMAWVVQEDERYILSGEAVKLSKIAPKQADADYNYEIVNISNILVSDDKETKSYNASLSLIEDSNPLKFILQKAVLNSSSTNLHETQHACISNFNTPQPVLIEGLYHIRYELLLQNISPEVGNVSRIEVWDGSSMLEAFEGDELDELFGNYRDTNTGFVFITLKLDYMPQQLLNRVILTTNDQTHNIVRNHEIDMDHSSILLIGSPVPSGVWYYGSSGNHDHHAHYLSFQFGNPLNSQRWAVDLAKASIEEKNICLGDCSRNEQFFGYDSPFIAVADGTIVAVNDGIKDNIPGQTPEPSSGIHPGGNFVLQDIGQGIYAFYSHAIPNSIEVKVGDKVKRGQVLGKIGNSGNSDAPHLHFHLARGYDIDNVLNAEGIPFYFEKFNVIDGLTGKYLGERMNAMPANEAIIVIE